MCPNCGGDWDPDAYWAARGISSYPYLPKGRCPDCGAHAGGSFMLVVGIAESHKEANWKDRRPTPIEHAFW